MLSELFAPEIEYLPSPWGEPVVGLDALAEFWEAERHGADEKFAIRTEVVAVEMETAVVRVEVDYASPLQRWRDLWLVVFAPAGRCVRFEEWPFAPSQGDGH
jgi:hypothetical protein